MELLVCIQYFCGFVYSLIPEPLRLLYSEIWTYVKDRSTELYNWIYGIEPEPVKLRWDQQLLADLVAFSQRYKYELALAAYLLVVLLIVVYTNARQRRQNAFESFKADSESEEIRDTDLATVLSDYVVRWVMRFEIWLANRLIKGLRSLLRKLELFCGQRRKERCLYDGMIAIHEGRLEFENLRLHVEVNQIMTTFEGKRRHQELLRKIVLSNDILKPYFTDLN